MSKSLVLVVGAGASKEVGLPIGAELRSKIAEALNIQYEYGRTQVSGSKHIDNAFRVLVEDLNPPSNNINSHLESSWRIRDAMPQAISIDNFIDSHREDERIAICGKLAIANCILAAEAESDLYVHRREHHSKIDFTSVESTWFNAFFQLLTENCREQEIEARLGQVAIITFNYDRCIEHYLHGALQNYYGVSSQRAAEALKQLQVFHPYGSVGTLPWQQGEGIEFGASLHGRKLVQVSKGIRTFTEGTDPEHSDVESIQSVLNKRAALLFSASRFIGSICHSYFPAWQMDRSFQFGRHMQPAWASRVPMARKSRESLVSLEPLQRGSFVFEMI